MRKLILLSFLTFTSLLNIEVYSQWIYKSYSEFLNWEVDKVKWYFNDKNKEVVNLVVIDNSNSIDFKLWDWNTWRKQIVDWYSNLLDKLNWKETIWVVMFDFKSSTLIEPTKNFNQIKDIFNSFSSTSWWWGSDIKSWIIWWFELLKKYWNEFKRNLVILTDWDWDYPTKNILEEISKEWIKIHTIWVWKDIKDEYLFQLSNCIVPKTDQRVENCKNWFFLKSSWFNWDFSNVLNSLNDNKDWEITDKEYQSTRVWELSDEEKNQKKDESDPVNVVLWNFHTSNIDLKEWNLEFERNYSSVFHDYQWIIWNWWNINWYNEIIEKDWVVKISFWELNFQFFLEDNWNYLSKNKNYKLSKNWNEFILEYWNNKEVYSNWKIKSRNWKEFFFYSDKWELEKIQDEFWRWFHLIYKNWFITNVISTSWDIVEYSYDNKWNLIKVKKNKWNDKEYHYDDLNRIISIKKENWKVTLRNKYDDLYRVIEQEDVEWNKSFFKYSHWQTVFKDNLWNDTTYYYDNNFNIIKRVNQVWNSQDYLFWEWNKLLRYIDENWVSYSYEYDKDWRIIKRFINWELSEHSERDSKWNIIKITDSSWNSIEYKYDWNWNVINKKDRNWEVENYSYNDQNKLIKSEWTILKNFYEYNVFWDLIKDNLFEYSDFWVKNLLWWTTTIWKDSNWNISILRDWNWNKSYKKYDEVWNIIEEIDWEWNIVKNTFDDKWNIIESLSSSWLKRKFEYDKNWNLISEYLWDVKIQEFKYWKDWKIVEIKDWNWNSWKITYEKWRVHKSENKNLVREIYSYDNKWRLIARNIEWTKLSEKLFYDDKWNLEKKILNWVEVNYWYDNNWNITLEDNRKIFYSWDLITKFIDWEWNEFSYKYDQFWNLTKDEKWFEYKYDWNFLKSFKDSNWNIHEYEYYDDWQIKNISVNWKLKVSYLINKNWDIVWEIDWNWNSIEYKLNSEWKIISKKNKNWDFSTYSYDERWNLLEETDFNWNKTKYSYDNNWNVLTITNSLWWVKEFKYNKIWLLTNVKDENWWEYWYEYDYYWRILKEKNELWWETRNIYNEFWRLVSHKKFNWETENYEYSNEWNVISKKINWTTVFNSIEYDKNNRVKRINYKNWFVSEFKYDKHWNILKTHSNDVEKTFDWNWNIVKEVDWNWIETRYKYNEDNLIIEKISWTIKTQFEYDNSWNIIKKIRWDWKYKTFWYDKNWNLIEESDYMWNKSYYSYDKNWNLISSKDRNWNEVLREYDSLNRLVKIKNEVWLEKTIEYYNVWNAIKIKDFNWNIINFTYDKNWNQTFIESWKEKIRKEYNNHWKLTFSTRNWKDIRVYYNNFWKITDIWWKQIYSYDELWRLKEFTSWENKLFYDYYENDLLKEIRIRDRWKISYDYWKIWEVISKKIFNNSWEIVDETVYKYDQNYNVIEQNSKDLKIKNTYDSIWRKIETSYSYWNINKIEKYSYDDNWYLIWYENSFWKSWKYEYDKNWNMIKDWEDTLEYDLENKLIKKWWKELRYDWNWNLIFDWEKNLKWNEFEELVQIWEEVLSYDSLNRLNNYNWVEIEREMLWMNEFNYWKDFFINWLNWNIEASVNNKSLNIYWNKWWMRWDILTTSTNENKDLFDFWPFWDNLRSINKQEILKSYQWKRRINWLDYFWNRFYSSELKRFISKDNFPIIQWEVWSMNRYLYSLNDPVNYYDENWDLFWLDNAVTWWVWAAIWWWIWLVNELWKQTWWTIVEWWKFIWTVAKESVMSVWDTWNIIKWVITNDQEAIDSWINWILEKNKNIVNSWDRFIKQASKDLSNLNYKKLAVETWVWAIQWWVVWFTQWWSLLVWAWTAWTLSVWKKFVYDWIWENEEWYWWKATAWKIAFDFTYWASSDLIFNWSMKMIKEYKVLPDVVIENKFLKNINESVWSLKLNWIFNSSDDLVKWKIDVFFKNLKKIWMKEFYFLRWIKEWALKNWNKDFNYVITSSNFNSTWFLNKFYWTNKNSIWTNTSFDRFHISLNWNSIHKDFVRDKYKKQLYFEWSLSSQVWNFIDERKKSIQDIFIRKNESKE